eukprot:CAMPEP_0170476806 /NCGR_PEP_ID=MMETSP0123-20130129/18153_1 /TAXON_ID=182087 /ORGANISM="Favella ehrenbergii, Strain Fehren 1" /LENGTH=130 /DNA_ID=CAMNT_0010748077 /DNA_START=915 /DNA_END=1304 /DNA_ORIENTATION=-
MIFKFAATSILLLCLVLIFARTQIVQFFTEDEALTSMTETLMFVLGCSFMVDGMQAIHHGPIRALGLQKRAGYIAISCYWLLGLPLAALLAFKCNFGVYGLMAGFSSASLVELISYALVLLSKDWQKVAE